MKNFSEDIYLLWLSSLAGRISSRRLNALLDVFGTAREVFLASNSALEREGGLAPHALLEITNRRNALYIDKLRRALDTGNIAYYSIRHEMYPRLLREIPDPPIGIFCMGTPPSDDNKIAVIGSRKCSEYGLLAAELLSTSLAASGVIIVSGMARGVDSMAHRGALAGRGKTVAVLGCGVDICYPLENRALKDEIIKNGCIISEYPPGVRPSPAFFPARNRIISGLSVGVVVVEARAKSGTIITVNQAIEQGREVFAVPGNIYSKLSEGTNQLISEGATPVLSHKDILLALGIDRAREQKSNIQLAPDEKQVYDSLGSGPVSFDILADLTNLEPGRVHLICTGLEVKGLLKKLPGSRYMKK